MNLLKQPSEIAYEWKTCFPEQDKGAVNSYALAVHLYVCTNDHREGQEKKTKQFVSELLRIKITKLLVFQEIVGHLFFSSDCKAVWFKKCTSSQVGRKLWNL